jgi:hypothetical protein
MGNKINYIENTEMDPKVPLLGQISLNDFE